MKRILAVVLVLCFCLCSMGMAYADKYIVNTEKDQLRVRDVNDSSIILGKLKKGTIIEAFDTDKFWAYINYNGKVGKVYLSYLKKVDGNSSSSSNGSSNSSASSHSTYVYKDPVSTDEASKLFTVKDTVKDCINARVSKSTSARSLGKLRPGDVVYVINVGYKWSRVVYDEQYAYVLTKYIEEYGPNLPEDGDLYEVIVKEGTTLNVREEPSKNATVLRKIPNGAYVKVIEELDDWYKVLYQHEGFGYVMKKFVESVY